MLPYVFKHLSLTYFSLQKLKMSKWEIGKSVAPVMHSNFSSVSLNNFIFCKPWKHQNKNDKILRKTKKRERERNDPTGGRGGAHPGEEKELHDSPRGCSLRPSPSSAVNRIQFILQVDSSCSSSSSADTVGERRHPLRPHSLLLLLLLILLHLFAVPRSVTDQLSPSSEVVDEHRHAVCTHQVVWVSGERFVLPRFGVTCGNKLEVSVFILQNPTPPPHAHPHLTAALLRYAKCVRCQRMATEPVGPKKAAVVSYNLREKKQNRWISNLQRKSADRPLEGSVVH